MEKREHKNRLLNHEWRRGEKDGICNFQNEVSCLILGQRRGGGGGKTLIFLSYGGEGRGKEPDRQVEGHESLEVRAREE